MKRLLLVVLLAMAFVAKAQTITIGEGTGMTSQVPFNTFYNYSFTEQLYQAGEIEYAGNIKAVSFRIAYSYNTECTADIAVYLKNVSKSGFSDPSDYEPVTPDDRVFSGSWTIPADYDGWITINFDRSFAYNGTDNLLVAIDENSDDFAIRYFRYTDVERSVLGYSSDSSNPDPYDLNSFSGVKEVSSQRANIKLVFGAPDGVTEQGVGALSIYPNPAEEVLCLDGVGEEMIGVYDAMGRLVIQEVYDGQLRIDRLGSGLYTVVTDKGVAKFLKK